MRRYKLAATATPPEEEFLRHAVISVDVDGATVVAVDGDPLFAFASLAQCLQTYELEHDDLEPLSTP